MALRRRWRAREPAHHDGNERWLLTYADLITLLLVFFVVLFAISRADAEKFAKVSASIQQALGLSILNPSGSAGLQSGGATLLTDFAIVQQILEQYARAQGLEGQVEVLLRSDGLAIVLSGNVLFRPGSAQLMPDAVGVLNRVAHVLRNRPELVRVEGHTDNVPVATAALPSNWELSALRAVAVTRYLNEVGQIPADRLIAAGYGEHRPVGDNATRLGRTQNRRVEIVLLSGAPEALPERLGQLIVPDNQPDPASVGPQPERK